MSQLVPPATVVPTEEAFRLLLGLSVAGFSALDLDGRYVFVSQSLCTLLELDESVLLGRQVSEFLLHEDRAALRELIASARDATRAKRSAAQSQEEYIRVRHACGASQLDSDRMLLAVWKPVEVRAYASDAFVYVVMLDASMPYKADGRLADLLVHTSHDLRTPCSSLQSTASLMREMPTVSGDPEALMLLSTVEASCAVLLRSVDNLLFMRKSQKRIEASALDGGGPSVGQLLTRRSFNVRQAVATVVDNVRSLCAAPSQLVHNMDECAIPDAVIGDSANFIGCLFNICMMAMRMGAWMDSDSPVPLRFKIELRDEGAGGLSTEQPPPEYREVALLALVEVPGRPLTLAEVQDLLAPYGMLPADKGGCTGLPLSVARALAQRTGGDVEVYPSGATTVLALHYNLHAPTDGAVSAEEIAMAALGRARGNNSPLVAPLAAERLLGPQRLAPTLPNRQAVAPPERMVRQMFECLIRNCTDIFCVCAFRSTGEKAVLTWLQYVSPSLHWVFGLVPADILGRPLTELCYASDRASFEQALAAAHSSGQDVLFRHRSPGGEGFKTLWCRTAGSYGADAILYTVCRSDKFPESVEVGVRAFDVACSHELREPCNTISVSLQVLNTRPCVRDAMQTSAAAAGPSDSDALSVAQLANILVWSAGLLQGIVGNIVATPMVESGALELAKQAINPLALLEQVVAVCRHGIAATRPSGDEGGTTIELRPQGCIPDAPLPVPSLVEGDGSRLSQIVQNLVTNACKFPHPGRTAPVIVCAGCAIGQGGDPDADDKSSLRLVVTVTDQGRGMTPEEVTDCFKAGTAAPTSAGGGTGLGLFLSRAFAHLMQGDLTCESTPGVGTTFRLDVPVKMIEALSLRSEPQATGSADAGRAAHGYVSTPSAIAAGAAVASPPLVATSPVASSPRFRVLLADDHALNLRLMTRLLQLNGFAVTSVCDGQQALDALIASYNGTLGDRFDLAILDMEMPKMSGPQATAAFRGWEQEHRPATLALPIAALTANVLDEHAAMCAEAGMNLFLCKPLRNTDVPLLQAHAAASFNHRRLETLAASLAGNTPEVTRAIEAAAAAAETARTTLGIPIVASKGLKRKQELEE